MNLKGIDCVDVSPLWYDRLRPSITAVYRYKAKTAPQLLTDIKTNTRSLADEKTYVMSLVLPKMTIYHSAPLVFVTVD